MENNLRKTMYVQNELLVCHQRMHKEPDPHSPKQSIGSAV